MNDKKSRLQVLCVAMNQQDTSLAEKMNVSSDIIIANQADRNEVVEENHVWGRVKMVTTTTRGVGKNRNIAFMHADGEILLLSDDDICYTDKYVEDVLGAFDSLPDADVIIFNITSSDSSRKQVENRKTRKLTLFSRLPYGAPRIAIRRSSWEKSNVWFSLLFGGGAKYSNGEDTIFLNDLKGKKMVIYVSEKNIGTIDMGESSWYKGTNEEFYFNKGVLCANQYPAQKIVRMIYFLFRVKSKLSIQQRVSAFLHGFQAYGQGKKYLDYFSDC